MSIQSGINNILGATAVAATTLKKGIEEKQQADFEAKKEAAIKDLEELKSRAETEEKLSDARAMAVGYTAKDLKKQKAAKAMGIELPQKNPRGVSKQTYDRRMANAKAMEQIHTRYVQDADFRKRLESIKTEDIAEAIKGEIRSKKKGGKK